MSPSVPWVFLHPGHGGEAGALPVGIELLSLAAFVAGLGLVAFGVWQLYGAGSDERSREESADASAER